MAPLPHPPHVRARITRDDSASASAGGGFVNLRRLQISVEAPGGVGTPSAPFAFDIATRRAIDAVIVVAHFRVAGAGERHVYLRSCPRPALMLHDGEGGPREGNLWELAAGLLEPGESPRVAAARELHEELGFDLPPADLVPLGTDVYPAPGFIAERHHYFQVTVNPHQRQVPAEDGSPLEANALIVSLPLSEALSECRAGVIVDAKTELALRRLAEVPLESAL